MTRQGPPDFAIRRRIHFIFSRAARRFKGDERLWMQWIDFAERRKADKRLERIYGRALAVLPHSVIPPRGAPLAAHPARRPRVTRPRFPLCRAPDAIAHLARCRCGHAQPRGSLRRDNNREASTATDTQTLGRATRQQLHCHGISTLPGAPVSPSGGGPPLPAGRVRPPKVDAAVLQPLMLQLLLPPVRRAPMQALRGGCCSGPCAPTAARASCGWPTFGLSSSLRSACSAGGARSASTAVRGRRTATTSRRGAWLMARRLSARLSARMTARTAADWKSVTRTRTRTEAPPAWLLRP